MASPLLDFLIHPAGYEAFFLGTRPTLCEYFACSAYYILAGFMISCVFLHLIPLPAAF